MVALTAWQFLLLFGVGLVAGLVDSVAGGGGMITLPVLLSVGFSPALALGTNKLQSSFGSSTAAWHYARAGLVEIKACRLGILATLIGAVLGAMAVQRIDPKALQILIPWLLAGVMIYLLMRPAETPKELPPKMRPGIFFIVFGLALGFYDAFLGPGTGSFWTVLIIALLGYNFLKATAATKVMNATSNLVALAIFISGGTVAYKAGLAMGAGQLIGARVGTRLAVKRGSRFIKPFFLAIVALLIVRLVYTQSLAPAR